jgi:hypothetical protein
MRIAHGIDRVDGVHNRRGVQVHAVHVGHRLVIRPRVDGGMEGAMGKGKQAAGPLQHPRAGFENLVHRSFVERPRTMCHFQKPGVTGTVGRKRKNDHICRRIHRQGELGVHDWIHRTSANLFFEQLYNVLESVFAKAHIFAIQEIRGLPLLLFPTYYYNFHSQGGH